MKEKKAGIRSAYELALERLASEQGPRPALTDEQKKALAEVDRQATAKVAEIEILMNQRIAEARQRGDEEQLQKLQEQKRADIERVRARAESDKERIRQGG